jgi:hypothetical protein
MKCARCSSKLPKNSNFCVACGSTNEATKEERFYEIDRAVEKQHKKTRNWIQAMVLFLWFKALR